MENSHKESLLSAVENFLPQTLPNPSDFSESDRDGMEEEELLDFGVRPYMFELLSTAGREREREPAHLHNVWSCATVDN